MLLADLPEPDTATARLALEVATAYCSPALLHHSVRSYFFAAAYGLSRGITFDAELLYVAAVCHDLGLVEEFDSHTVPFEEAGGHLVWVFTAGAGWPVERRRRAAQVVVHHMGDIDPADDAEGHLLAVATSLDISGANPQLWPAELRSDLVRAYPRLDLATEFLRCFTDQAGRKPDSRAAASVRSGIAERIAGNVLDQG